MCSVFCNARCQLESFFYQASKNSRNLKELKRKNYKNYWCLMPLPWPIQRYHFFSRFSTSDTVPARSKLTPENFHIFYHIVVSLFMVL
jgi:hypothetical protein